MIEGIERQIEAFNMCKRLKLLRNEALLYISLYCLDLEKLYTKKLIYKESLIRSKTTFYRIWKKLEAKGLLIELQDRFVLFGELGAAFRVNDESSLDK